MKEHSEEFKINSLNNNIPLMAKCAWHLSLAALFPHNMIALNEAQEVQLLLRDFMRQSADPYQEYLEICQRVLLTRERILEDPGFYTSPSALRFFSNQRKGYALSELPFSEMMLARKIDPLYNLPLKALAEGILEMAEEPTQANYCYWTCWFLEQEAWDENLLFQLFNTFSTYNAGAYE